VSPAVPPLATVKTASILSSFVTSWQRTRSTPGPNLRSSCVSLPAAISASWITVGLQTAGLAAAFAGRRASAVRAMRKATLVTARL